MTTKPYSLIALLVAGGCAVDTDLAETAQHVAGSPVLLPDSGTGQNREVMSSFDPLVVMLFDTYGNPIEGATVTFTAPATGPSATLRFDGQVETDATGRAELRPYANQWAGTYTVWAHADGAQPMPFVLTNSAAPPAVMLPLLGTDQARPAGMPFEYPLTIEVRDNYGNVVEGAPVEFVAPASGATTRLLDGNVAVTGDDGRAAVFAVAGDVVGTYTVLATVAGAPAVPFELSNMERSNDTSWRTEALHKAAAHSFEQAP